MNAKNPEDPGLSLRRALYNTGITVLYSDPDSRVVWAENVPPSWSDQPIIGQSPAEFLPAEAAGHLARAKESALTTSQSQKLEIGVPAADGMVWFSVWVDCDKSSTGGARGVVTTAVDITEQKRREQTLRTLLRELAHRSKNLLAIIQSIATQTGRHSGSIENFLLRFRGRLQSLASTQDLVTSSNWRGADLDELVASQVGRYVGDPAASVRLEGERPYLNPNAALHIGLALHELAVNSVSYGALARPDGRVRLTAKRGGASSDDALTLEWSEPIDISDSTVGQKRFGSTALERVVPASLNGTATLNFTPDRLIYRLVIPAGNFEME